jgi:chromosome segregation ATPase
MEVIKMNYEISNNNTPLNQENQDLSMIVQELQRDREKIILSENPSENDITNYIDKSLKYIEELDQTQRHLQKELQNYDHTRDNVIKKINALETKHEAFKEALDRLQRRDEEIYKMLSNLTVKITKIDRIEADQKEIKSFIEKLTEKIEKTEINQKKMKSDIESFKEEIQTSNNVISGQISSILTKISNTEKKQDKQELMLYGMLGLLIAVLLILFFKL